MAASDLAKALALTAIMNDGVSIKRERHAADVAAFEPPRRPGGLIR